MNQLVEGNESSGLWKGIIWLQKMDRLAGGKNHLVEDHLLEKYVGLASPLVGAGRNGRVRF